MSALTDLFTAMANKIRTKTGTQTTYTPSEMVSDGIDDVYDAGVESATTPITPSNASPAPMTSGTGYKPTTNGYAIKDYFIVRPDNYDPSSVQRNDVCLIEGPGLIIESIINVTPSNSSPVRFDTDWIIKPTTIGYAIESYDSVTPSSSPASVASGDIVKIGGSGVIVDAIPTPTSITPSDSNPVALTADTPVNPTASGYAIESNPTGITPTNISTPPSITDSTIYKAIGNGYAIKDYTNCTPSDSSPNALYNGQLYRVQDPNKSTGVRMGYAIESYTDVQPLYDRDYDFGIGDIAKHAGMYPAKIIRARGTITPSAAGVAFANSGWYKMTSGGVAYSQQPKRVQTGSYTTNASSAVTINLDFTPSLVIVYSNIDTTTLAFIAISEAKGAFSGWNMNGAAAAHNIGTFTWSGNSFTHKAYSSAMGNKTAYYVAIE